MSIWVSGYTEVKINGKWYCRDFHQYDIDKKLHHIPCITGQSFVYHALEWQCNLQDLISFSSADSFIVASPYSS